ncbi:MAG: sulfotransferase [Myxococcota bacterium]|nr:sulfotransferase [Myxococcota bacterium]
MTDAGRYNPGDLRAARRIAERPDFFDRPLIVLSAPRSGSTLLYELLTRSSAVYGLGGESHGVIEELGGFDPMDGRVRSNRLNEHDADPDTVLTLRSGFLLGARDVRGVRYLDCSPAARPAAIRFIEKTPKNMLRVPFMRAVFPGARFVLLVRDAREAMSSMIEAWESGKFITYASLAGFRGPWSMLLPEGYQSVSGKPIDACVAFQWRESMRVVLADLNEVPRADWCAVGYRELVDDPAAVLRRIGALAELDFADVAAQIATGPLPLSTHTLSPPRPDKWERHAARLRKMLPLVADVERQAATLLAPGAPA